MTHPLDKLSAVVDGQLDHDSRDKVLSHLVGCDTCRTEVDAQRRLKARMAALETPDPSTDLMQRLMGVSSFSTEPREEVRPVVTPVSLFPQRSAFPAGRSTGGTRPGAARGARSRRRAGVLGAAGSAAAVASLLGTAAAEVGRPKPIRAVLTRTASRDRLTGQRPVRASGRSVGFSPAYPAPV